MIMISLYSMSSFHFLHYLSILGAHCALVNLMLFGVWYNTTTLLSKSYFALFISVMQASSKQGSQTKEMCKTKKKENVPSSKKIKASYYSLRNSLPLHWWCKRVVYFQTLTWHTKNLSSNRENHILLKIGLFRVSKYALGLA